MSTNKELLQQCFHGSIDDKQHWALSIHRQYGSSLLLDTELRNDFDLLKHYAQRVNAHMLAMRMGVLCAGCAQNNGGGCCSLYMAGETDGIQLLMNLLIGIDVEQARDDGVECCFLGRDGCLFLIKPFFCLNYNCAKIHDSASREAVKTLEKLTGQLLNKQYEIEKKLLSQLSLLQK